MRSLLAFILTAFCGLSFGQNFSYPAINPSGKAFADFIPFGWTVLDSATGDLNKDGIKDIAFVLQLKDSIKLAVSEEDSVLTQPRILVVLFKNPTDNKFYKKEQSNTFILRHDQENMDDPYQGLLIDKGIIKLDFQLFYTMGSWYTTSSTYKFRYDGKEFLLIGADLFTIHRATLDFEDHSYNFLTKKIIYSKGNDQKGTKKTTSEHLPIETYKTLKTFTQPYTWEIESDMYL